MTEKHVGLTSRYVHGTAVEEQRRLSLMNSFINDPSLRELDLRGGERILDVGSGLGQLSRAMARAAGPAGAVLGIERDPQQLAEAQRQARADGEEGLVEMRQGDAFDLPLRDDEQGTFDVAHTRFLLEHVPDPLTVVRAMVRAVRPGGRIVLSDDDHDVLRLWPPPPGFATLWSAYVRVYDRLGNDPYVGRRLVTLLHQAGAAPRRNSWIFFGACAGNAVFESVVHNLAGVLQGARDAILGAAGLESALFDEVMAAVTQWSRRADAALWYAMCWAEGVRP